MKVLLFLFSLAAFAQTQGTPTQIKVTGTPGAGLCNANNIGQQIFQTDATAGQNLFACTANGVAPTSLSASPPVQSGSIVFCSSVTGNDSYACNFSPAFTAYDTDGTCTSGEVCAGTVIQVYVDTANTGSATFAPNGLAGKTIKKYGKQQNLATGDISAGQVIALAYNRVSDVWQYQSQISVTNAVVAGALVLLQTQTASTSASLDFTSCISSAYDVYQFEITQIIPATNNVNLIFRVSTDGGSSYDSTNNYWDWGIRSNAGGFVQIGAGAAGGQISLTSGVALSNSSNWGAEGTAKFRGVNSAIYKRFQSEISGLDSASVRDHYQVSGSYESATVVNAVQFLMSTGNIASGTIRCYGLAQ